MRVIPAIFLALAPLPCLAEGAEQVWDCTARAVCSMADGHENDCAETDPAPHHFQIAPLETDADGRGRYRITHNGTAFDGEGQSFVGRFEWTEGGTMAFGLRADLRPQNQIAFDLFTNPTDQSAPMTRTSLDCEVTQ